MVMDSLVYVVPIYKLDLSPEELISFKRLKDLMSVKSIRIICPSKFQDKNLPDMLNGCRIEYFEDKFFASVAGYNKLMLDCAFYERFKANKYILIYQLDCYLFDNNIEDFLSLNLDYIGAPWPVKTVYRSFLKVYPLDMRMGGILRTLLGKSVTVGNGGLSLRKVESFIRVLKKMKWRLKNWNYNEDIFFSHCVPIYCPSFKIASEKVAAEFSLDQEPKEFALKYDLTLPLGCHGWNQTDKKVYTSSSKYWRERIILTN